MVAEIALASVEDLARRSSAVEFREVQYAPTGGNRVPSALLDELRHALLEHARSFGYPAPSTDDRAFDAAAGKTLHSRMGLAPSEASHQGVWAFLGCVLLPDLVRWRFPGGDKGTTAERFLGGARGIRNTFGRLWWRAEILADASEADPYALLHLLHEDEHVQIAERPNLAGDRRLARQLARAFLEQISATGASRSELMRDATKRVRRLLPILAFDALDEQAVQRVSRRAFSESARLLNESKESK